MAGKVLPGTGDDGAEAASGAGNGAAAANPEEIDLDLNDDDDGDAGAGGAAAGAGSQTVCAVPSRLPRACRGCASVACGSVALTASPA